jgi:small subunit ribosomal protein S1
VDFGAFVDLDGIDGLIHISELSWSHVNHPSEILTIGDTVQVKVLDIDRDRQRISLGLKQTQEDPWQRIVDTYSIGDELAGKVTKVVTFGAFVEILDGVEGLVHISELAAHHVESPREVVHPDDEIRVKILEIDSERRRLSLSAKRVEDQILPLNRPASEGELPQIEAEQVVEAEQPAVEEPLAVEVAEQPEQEAQEPSDQEPSEQQPVAEEVAVEEPSEQPDPEVSEEPSLAEAPETQASAEEPADATEPEPEH